MNNTKIFLSFTNYHPFLFNRFKQCTINLKIQFIKQKMNFQILKKSQKLKISIKINLYQNKLFLLIILSINIIKINNDKMKIYNKTVKNSMKKNKIIYNICNKKLVDFIKDFFQNIDLSLKILFIMNLKNLKTN